VDYTYTIYKLSNRLSGKVNREYRLLKKWGRAEKKIEKQRVVANKRFRLSADRAVIDKETI